MDTLLVIDAIPYISKYIEEEISFWQKGVESLLAITVISPADTQAIRSLIDKVKKVDFNCDITFDISELISWKFTGDTSFLDEEKYQNYLVGVLPEVEDWGSDIVGEKSAIALNNPPAELVGGLSYIPMYQKPKSKENIYLDPPAWVLQGVKLTINTQSSHQGELTWDIWERTMSISTSDGERYFTLESRLIDLDNLFPDQ